MRMMIAGDGHAACRIGLLCRVGAGPFEGGDQGPLQAPVSSRRTDLAGRLLRLETSCLPPRAPDWRRRGVRGLRVLPRGDCVHVGLQPHRPGDEAVMPGARRMGRFDDAWLHRCVHGHRSLRPAHGRAAAVRLPGSAPLRSGAAQAGDGLVHATRHRCLALVRVQECAASCRCCLPIHRLLSAIARGAGSAIGRHQCRRPVCSRPCANGHRSCCPQSDGRRRLAS